MGEEEVKSIPADYLALAGLTLKTRARERGKEIEDVMDSNIQLFNLLTHSDHSTSEGYLFMILLKITRMLKGIPSKDDVIDLIAYSALLGVALEGETDDYSRKGTRE